MKRKVKESLSSVLPVTVIALRLRITLVPQEVGTLALFLTGAMFFDCGDGGWRGRKK